MCMITWLHGVWFVEIYKALHGMWFVVLNANFIRSYHFHPYPSPRHGKCCHLKKRRKIALCGRIALFYLHMIPYGVIFFIIEQKFENDRLKSTGQKIDCSPLRITWYNFFVKPYLQIPVNIIYYHFPNYPYYTNYPIAYSIQLYRYYNTVIIL